VSASAPDQRSASTVTERPRISACVIARDDARTLMRCLESLAWCDERVVLLDARSCDASADIAKAAGARVERAEYTGNVAHKNRCLSLAQGDWIVSLDADEALSPELADWLRAQLRSSDAFAGIAGIEIDRLTWHLGRWIRHGDFSPDWQLRVFRREQARWEGIDPHGRARVAGRVLRAHGSCHHFSYADLSDQLARVRDFSAAQARALHASGHRFRLRDLVLRPPARFLRAYLLKRGCLDGLAGFVIAVVTAFYVFAKYAALWELEQRPPPA
jgi:glycosyltransferase involved in cell wall biosynthesis